MGEKECEIPAEDIRRISREFAAAAPRAVYYQGRRSSFFDNGTQIKRAMTILNGIVGNWDTMGGMVPSSKTSLDLFWERSSLFVFGNYSEFRLIRALPEELLYLLLMPSRMENGLQDKKNRTLDQ